MEMPKDQEAEALISDIRRQFPDVAEKIDERLEHFGLSAGDNAYSTMFEAFSQATTDAIKHQDGSTVSSHLAFMSQKLASATSAQREYIDVYYVEPLMWDIRQRRRKRWAWNLMPENLQELYIRVWGKPDF
jgi:hypothetical protein